MVDPQEFLSNIIEAYWKQCALDNSPLDADELAQIIVFKQYEYVRDNFMETAH